MEVAVGVFVSYCCVTNHKALICKYLFSLMVSVGQVFGNSQRGWYGLGFLGVKMQPEGFIADGGSTPTAAMQCWRRREAQPLFTGCLSVLAAWWLASPERVVRERESQAEAALPRPCP